MKKGDRVTWSWGQGTAEGKIVETVAEKVTRKIKGREITRNGSKEEPAYLIAQDDADQVLKSGSELDKA
jgi:Hypervirulence associated proteins TUDOR domain